MALNCLIKSAAAFLPAAPDFRKILLLVCPLILTSCSTPPLPEESEPVVDLMAERLVLARDVAWAKWASGLPVRDPAREAIVVERLMRQGEIAGLEELSVLRFVKAQIEASCLEQESWMAKWGKDTPLPAGDPPALESLRQRLDRSSALLLAEWAGTPSTSPAAVRARLLPSVINPRSAAVAASGFPPQEKSPFRAGDLR